jgi:transcriptional regulator with GAF, ATPase, and Fis domain
MQDGRVVVTTATHGRYRALLEVSSAIAEQPSLDAVLGSLRGVLSGIVCCDSVDLYMLSDDNETLHLIAFDHSPELPAIRLGTKLPGTGTLADRVIQEQQPVYLADIAQEMVKIPELACFRDRGTERLRFSCFDFPQAFRSVDFWKGTGSGVSSRRPGIDEVRCFARCRRT